MSPASAITVGNAFDMMMTGIAKTIAEDSTYGWSDFLPEITLMCSVHEDALKEAREEAQRV